MARSDDLCDAIDALITTASAGDAATSITKAYAPDQLRPDMSGKYVYIFSDDPKVVRRLTRSEVVWEYPVGIVIVERYGSAAAGSSIEKVPVATVTAFKDWVKAYVFNVLNPRTAPADWLVNGAFYPARCDIATEIDEVRLLEDKTLWSKVEIDYREKYAG